MVMMVAATIGPLIESTILVVKAWSISLSGLSTSQRPGIFPMAIEPESMLLLVNLYIKDIQR